MSKGLPIQARRIFRLALTMSLTLAVAYGLAFDLPYIAVIFALMFTVKPAPPMGYKSLFGLVIVLAITTGSGLLLIPILNSYPVTALMLIALGLFFANYLTVEKGKVAVGSLLTMGLTLISAAGYGSFAMGRTVVVSLLLSAVLAVLCQRFAYLLFPELPQPKVKKAKPAYVSATDSNWIAIRATLIVFPAYLIALINPVVYLPVIMKSVSLGQQVSLTDARHAGKELLGSTFLAGVFSVFFWYALKLHPNLWMFSLWMLAFGIYFACKLYGFLPSRYSGAFWSNVVITMLIMVGPAVQDTASGKDVYKAFAVRISLFIAVTLYAWATLRLFEWLRDLTRKPEYSLNQ